MSGIRDLETRADIDQLMHVFYKQAFVDNVIGHIFTDVVKLDLEEHLPIIGDFWESLIFGTPAYAKHGRSPMVVHADLNSKYPLSAEHFERWLEIFIVSVDKEFRGQRAELLKERARAIGSRMQVHLGIRKT